MNDILYVTVPCYNEEEVLPETSKRLKAKIESLIEKGMISSQSRIVFIDDGSKDKTWQLISELCNADDIFAGIKLAHNRGHQNALLAGLMTAKEYADIVISMDADLQDDIDAVDKFVEEYHKGADIVYGVRSSRKTDTAFKRSTALAYYRILQKMGVDIVYNHADYRLMSKRALEGLSKFNEVNLFLRGIVPLIGYKTATVEYERSERFAGESKYPLKKMLAFAIDGITSFSIKPIRFITGLGFIIFILSLLMLVYSVIVKIIGHADSGWASIICSIWMIGGIQLLSLGVIGEYIGKIYSETKSRPRFIIEEFIKK
ncbi:MAG: glycosyltransferase family 2 protein [Clostridia bacterium]|nr:glycosyltransferase family 2 protein [Clostridia bacterium]